MKNAAPPALFVLGLFIKSYPSKLKRNGLLVLTQDSLKTITEGLKCNCFKRISSLEKFLFRLRMLAVKIENLLLQLSFLRAIEGLTLLRLSCTELLLSKQNRFFQCENK